MEGNEEFHVRWPEKENDGYSNDPEFKLHRALQLAAGGDRFKRS